MRSARTRLRTLLLLSAEAVLIFGCLVAATEIRLIMGAPEIRLGQYEAYRNLVEQNGFYKAALVSFFCLGAFYLYDLYDFVVMHDRRELILRLIQALGLAWIALALVFYLAPQARLGIGISGITLPLALAIMVGWRVSIHWLLGHPNVGERILIVGSGDSALEIAREVLERRDAGFRIVGFVDNRPELVGESIINPRVVGLTRDLPEIVRREDVDRIIVAQGERRGQFPTEQLLALSLGGAVAIEEGASFYERVTGRVHLNMMRPSWLIFSGRGRQARIAGFIRTITHRGVALIGGIISLPIALLTALLIKLESPGPALYKQARVGQNGRPFTIMKFRSMRVDAEKDGPVWATTSDDRTTRVGRIIRVIRVDEIPQFWNILKGEMNFVGPRPERPHFVKQLAQEIPFYEQRHLIPPGLTGWAQIKYPYGASIEDARQKLQYDLYYIKNQSLMLDAVILFETVKTILFGRGGR